MSNNSRHHAREIALQILYRFDSAQGDLPLPEAAGLAREINAHFEHFQAPEAIRPFAAELVAGTLRERSELDGFIEKVAAHWKVARMAIIDRNLLRMAVYEMRHFSDIPPSVTIDEAIELSKQFGNAESPAFVNGVLDAIRPQVRAG
jgi:N utilization substance protein B